MKIKKSELITALESVSPFCGNSLTIFTKVLIDGPNGTISATDAETWAEVPVACSEFMRQVAGEEAPETTFPDNALREDMDSLKKTQLESLCEYAGIEPAGKKAEMVEAIMVASLASAEAEKANVGEASTIEIGEVFCVDPKQLLKIVKSLDLRDDDYVSLSAESFEYQENILESVQATTLNVGDHFQKLMITPASDFPKRADADISRPFAEITGEDLRNIAAVSEKNSDKGFQRAVAFDSTNQQIVACDGKRLHAMQAIMAAADPGLLALHGETMKNIAKIAKKLKIDIKMNATASHLKFSVAGMAVYVQPMDEVKFPSYLDIMQKELEHSVTVDRKALQEAISQAMLISDAYVDVAFNGGINITATGESGTYDRKNVPFLRGAVQPEITRRFRPKFLLDALKGAAEKALINVGLEEGPLYVKRDGVFQACIMPMQA